MDTNLEKPNFETLPSPEQKVEQVSSSENSSENSSEKSIVKPLNLVVDPPSSSANLAALISPKDAELIKIENTLASGLDILYRSLPSDRQILFKQRGEETALKIKVLLHQVKVKISDLVVLILNWLKLIPGLNRFFIEQQALIKAQQLMRENSKK